MSSIRIGEEQSGEHMSLFDGKHSLYILKTFLSRYWKQGLIVFLALYSLPVMAYIIMGTLSPMGAKDFHQFWYAGQFILLGRDPYQAYFAGTELPMRQPGLEVIPSNTPPMLLVLSLFSLLPWTAAKLAWLSFDLVLVYKCFRLVEHYLPFSTISLDRPTKILILLIFFDLSPTRIAVENGQTTLFVFVLMLMAILLADRSWLLAGLLFGLALSKYSVSLSVMLLFLFQRKYRLLIVSVLTQLFGFVSLALVSGNPILMILREYLALVILLIDQPGIHLAYLVPGTSLDLLFSGLMTVGVFVPLYFWLVRRRQFISRNPGVLNFHFLTILMIWTLLVAYHRLYDALTLLLLVVLVFKSLQRTDVWNLSARLRTILVGVLNAGLALLIFPARLADLFWPPMYDLLNNKVPALILLVFLTGLMFLFYRFLNRPLQAGS